MQKKAQSALEFLTTYAWAFFVMIIVVGAIAYFGVLRPQKILPERCSFGAEFTCLNYQISSANNQFKLMLKNNLPAPITISGISLNSETKTQYACTSPSLPISNLPSGSITELAFTSCNTVAAGFVAGDKAKVLIKITYYDAASGSGYSRDVQGEVFAAVS